MKRILLLIVLLPAILFGQKKSEKKETIIKTNLSSLIDIFSFPTVQFAAERTVAKDFSVSIEAGCQLFTYKRYDLDTSFVTDNGFKLNAEFRYYDILRIFRGGARKSAEPEGLYMGANLFYRQQTFNNCLSYIRQGIEQGNKDCYWGRKKAGGLNFVAGYQQELFRGIVIDVYSGLGVVYRDTRNYNREYDSRTDSIPVPIDMNIRTLIDDASLSEHSGWLPNWNCGVRAGIILGKLHRGKKKY